MTGRRVVIHGEAGFLSEVGDTESLARDSRKLLTDDALRKEMSLTARRLASEVFTWEEVVSSYEDSYLRALSSSE